MSEKNCGDCTIDWEVEDEDDEDEYGPYATPNESRKREREIDRKHAEKIRRYEREGKWDD